MAQPLTDHSAATDAPSVLKSSESRAMQGVAAVATGSNEPRPAAEYSDEELVELYQQICARVGAYNTEILIERMFELRAELLNRLAARSNIGDEPRAQRK